MMEQRNQFESYYKRQNVNRTLDWQYQYGYVNMATLFTSAKYLLKVSIAQASILLQFDELNADVMSIQILLDMTQLSFD